MVSRTLEEHIQHLQAVLVRLREAGLRLKPKKCCFLREAVQFLGHVLSKHGICPDPAKTENVKHLPYPH